MRLIAVFSFSLLLLNVTATAQTDTRLLRYPDIHRDQVVFSHAGDLYVARTVTGEARKLTSHDGQEVFGKFSPDGRRIAFSAEYDGTRQVYVIPTEGGVPRQLTWYNDVGPMPPRGGVDYRVLDWTPDGKHVLIRANRLPWGPRMGRYFLVPAEGGNEVALSIPKGGGGMYGGDANTIVYTPIDREFRSWKRYRGGRAQDIWIYNLATNTAQSLGEHPATDNQPVWVNGDIFFTSDRDYTLNLYRHEENGDPVAVTRHKDFDVLWPSAGPEAIVYENGGYLHRYNPQTNETAQLTIRIGNDRAGRVPHIVEAAEFIDFGDLAPNGKRALFTARGDVFSVPAKNGPIRNVTATPAARELAASWSPDGQKMAWLSDASGEYELWIRSTDGNARQLTKGGDIWRFPPVWSPDGRYLMFGNKRQQLRIANVSSGRIQTIDNSSGNDIADYSWAPDSRHVAYVKLNEAGFGSIWIADIERGKPVQATADMTNDTNPVFDPEGRYLYFLSSRDFDLQFSSIEFNYMVTNSTRVYAAQLTEDAPALWRPKSDEAAGANENVNEKESEDSDDTDRAPFRIDIDGLVTRTVALQTSGGNYRALDANKDGPFYLSGTGPRVDLKHFDLAKEKEANVLAGIQVYTLSADGKSVLFGKGNSWGIAKAASGQDSDSGLLDLDDMELKVDPAVEWQQMYVDAWRILRDWFYDPNMHGQDWDAIRKRYEPLVAHVSHRTDLDYILGELAGEMNAGHIYVQSGDQPSIERRSGGLLGGDIVAADGFYRIAKIFDSEPWHQAFYSPLGAPGVNVSEGDYIIAVNGKSVRSVSNFYELLANNGGDVVTLRVNERPNESGARDVLVTTITSETQLRYLDWVNERARRVDTLSGGRIGYVHLPNTAVAGNRELMKRFLPQTGKEALIFDARYNGGGFIPDRMIEMVSRQPLNYWKRRGLDPAATPAISHRGPKATLINAYSSSGGDAFPYYFKKLGLGPLIGKRTWGGLIGISGNPMLADGGGVLASTFRFMDTEGNWAVENEGVEPDIEVLDRPGAIARGEDPTLEVAVKHLLDELERNPVQPVSVPAAPTEF